MFIKYHRKCRITLLILLTGLFFYGCKGNQDKYETWSSYLGDKTVSHYSSLRQIDTSNVQQLKVAWEYHTGDANSLTHSQIECNPIIVGGVLYGTSPQIKLFALDAATGKSKWVFDPYSGTPKSEVQVAASRGVTYWSDKDSSRIFFTGVRQYSNLCGFN